MEYVLSTPFSVATALIVTSLVGNEFAIAAFVHPQLYRLPSSAHARTASRLAAVMGKAMPLWYGLSLILIAGAAYMRRPINRGPGLLLTIAAILWVAIIALTVIVEVPINNRIARLNPDAPYTGWLEDRARWDAIHRARVFFLLIAAALVLTAFLQM